VDAGCTPTGILPAHLADQVTNLAGNHRPSGLATPHFPGPEPAKAGTMPGHDRFGLDDGQGRTPVAPEAGQPDPQQAVRWGQLAAFSRGALQHPDLVAQQSSLTQAPLANGTSKTECKECRKNNEHRRRIRIESIIAIRSDTSRFARGTMLWTLPRKDLPYGRKIIRNPLFWYWAISAGLAMAVVFGAVSRVL
jgi:hypothetical protein